MHRRTLSNSGPKKTPHVDPFPPSSLESLTPKTAPPSTNFFGFGSGDTTSSGFGGFGFGTTNSFGSSFGSTNPFGSTTENAPPGQDSENIFGSGSSSWRVTDTNPQTTQSTTSTDSFGGAFSNFATQTETVGFASLVGSTVDYSNFGKSPVKDDEKKETTGFGFPITAQETTVPFSTDIRDTTSNESEPQSVAFNFLSKMEIPVEPKMDDKGSMSNLVVKLKDTQDPDAREWDALDNEHETFLNLSKVDLDAITQAEEEENEEESTEEETEHEEVVPKPKLQDKPMVVGQKFEVKLPETEDPAEDAWDDVGEGENDIKSEEKQVIESKTVIEETKQNVSNMGFSFGEENQVPETNDRVEVQQSLGDYKSQFPAFPTEIKTEGEISQVKDETKTQDLEQDLEPKSDEKNLALTPVKNQEILDDQLSPPPFTQSPEKYPQVEPKNVPTLNFKDSQNVISPSFVKQETNQIDHEGFKIPLSRTKSPKIDSPLIKSGPSPPVSSPVTYPDYTPSPKSTEWKGSDVSVDFPRINYAKYVALNKNEPELIKNLKEIDDRTSNKLRELQMDKEFALKEKKKELEERRRAIEEKYKN